MAPSENIEKYTGNRYNFLIVLIVALGSFTYGFNNAIIGSVFGLPGFYSVGLLAPARPVRG